MVRWSLNVSLNPKVGHPVDKRSTGTEHNWGCYPILQRTSADISMCLCTLCASVFGVFFVYVCVHVHALATQVHSVSFPVGVFVLPEGEMVRTHRSSFAHLPPLIFLLSSLPLLGCQKGHTTFLHSSHGGDKNSEATLPRIYSFIPPPLANRASVKQTKWHIGFIGFIG